MYQVTVTEAPVGSLLARPVLDARGRVLLKAGTPLTRTVIGCLERWQIGTVNIAETSREERSSRPTNEALPVRWRNLFRSQSESAEVQTIHEALGYWYAAWRSAQGYPTQTAEQKAQP